LTSITENGNIGLVSKNIFLATQFHNFTQEDLRGAKQKLGGILNE